MASSTGNAHSPATENLPKIDTTESFEKETTENPCCSTKMSTTDRGSTELPDELVSSFNW